MDFIQKIPFKKIRLRLSDLLVSFDVESLFTQIPIKDTLNIIKASHEVSSDFIPLIEHCLTITYFSYNNQFYEQTSGMDSPIRCISLNPLFLSQKNTFFFPRKQKQIYSKYLPSLTIRFSHLSDNLCIPRQKNSSSFEANYSSNHFRTSS